MAKTINTKSCRAKKVAFLAAVSQCGVIARAADIAGVLRQSHYRWLNTDPEYPALFSAAMDEAVDRLEQEARRRATVGQRKLKFCNGKAVIDPDTGKPYVEYDYSDTLLMFLLNGARPEKYKRPAVEIQGSLAELYQDPIKQQHGDPELAKTGSS